MNHDESDLDLSAQAPDATMRTLMAQLEIMCSTSIDPARRAAIGQRLNAYWLEHRNSAAARRATMLRLPSDAAVSRGRRTVRPNKWLLSVAAALILGLSGGFGVLQLTNPRNASAAQILRRAATSADVPANQVAHEITVEHYASQPEAPYPAGDITSEQWTQVDGNGNPLQISLTSTDANSNVLSRLVASSSGQVWNYDTPSNTVVESAWSPGMPFFQGPPSSDPMAILFLAKETVDAPQDPKAMHDLLQAAADGSNGELALLPQQTIHGQQVDVVQVTRTPTGDAGLVPGVSSEVITVYIDPSTYLIRRIDLAELNDQRQALTEWSVDIAKYEVVPPDEVPPGTFTFSPPPGTKVMKGGVCLSESKGTQTGKGITGNAPRQHSRPVHPAFKVRPAASRIRPPSPYFCGTGGRSRRP